MTSGFLFGAVRILAVVGMYLDVVGSLGVTIVGDVVTSVILSAQGDGVGSRSGENELFMSRTSDAANSILKSIFWQ